MPEHFDFSFPEFRDPTQQGVWVWDSESKSMVFKPDNGLEQDRGHSTGGDNDLFNQNQIEHSELAGVPELEGHMARYLTIDEVREIGRKYLSQEWAPSGQVKCPLCEEATQDRVCPTCGKDLTPEWNNEEHQNNEFFGTPDDHNDASEFTSWPERVPKRNREKTDDSYPSMNLSSVITCPQCGGPMEQGSYGSRCQKCGFELGKQARIYEATQRLAARTITADDWDNMFSGETPLKTEIGKWLIDKQGQLHFDHGVHAQHENIAQRDGIAYPTDAGALGSVYNDGTADVQRVFPGYQFSQENAQTQITQAFGPVTLEAPVGQGVEQQTKGLTFEPFEVHGGQWIVNPQDAGQPITGVAWVKEKANGQNYQPNMILVAEHLQPEDFPIWSRGVTAIITATGGLTSHAAHLAMTKGIPVVVGIGAPYNKLETGDYLKIEPSTETITVMPGADSSMSSEQKKQISDTYMNYQLQRGGSVKPEAFAHYEDELAWREANTPSLEECPECRDPMADQDGQSVCHSCGHKQPIIQHNAGALLALPAAAEAIGIGGGEAAGAAGAAGAGGGGGLGGIGGLMNGALGRGVGFQMGKDLVPGGGQPQGQPGAPDQGGDMITEPGVLAHTAGVLSLLESFFDILKKTPEAFVDPKNPLSYADDVAGAAMGAQNGQQAMASVKDAAKSSLWDFEGAFGEEEVGRATENRGENSDPDAASESGTEGEKEHGDSPEQLKDIDGGGGSTEPHQGDPALQEKALKAFHMNMPLVIEFAHSDEPGSENPILVALDQLLEEAFPGYKDGQGDGEDEHPVEEINAEIPSNDGEPKEDKSEDESGEKPETGDSKESSWHEVSTEDLGLFEAGASPWGTPQSGPGTGVPMAAPAAGVAPGAPGVATCPMCGQSHLPGTPCPTDPSAITAPTAQGAPIMPPTPNKVITKWQVVEAAVMSCENCGNLTQPGTSCWSCGYNGNHEVGQVAPEVAQRDNAAQMDSYDQHRLHQVGAHVVDNEFAFFAAAEEGEHHSEQVIEHPHEGADETPWQDETGQPLQKGAQYELKSSNYAIPDRITVDRVLPDKLVYTTDSGDVNYRNEITAQDVATNAYTFAPVGLGHEELDSSDGFQDTEAPTRPGQDATPQVDDLSTPQTVVSTVTDPEAVEALTGIQNELGVPGEGYPQPVANAFEIAELALDNYTGSYAGDAPEDRSWLIESGSSEVAVDPVLMAKLAGADFSAREQREFIDESGTARNLDRLDLDGTHYIADNIDAAFNW